MIIFNTNKNWISSYLIEYPLVMRKVFIGGNWKCNNTLAKTKTIMDEVVDQL